MTSVCFQRRHCWTQPRQQNATRMGNCRWMTGQQGPGMIDEGDVLVFASKKAAVDEIESQLARKGFKVAALHGDKDQASWMDVLQKYKSGIFHVLVATDVAARGLDIKSIKSNDMDVHVHRIGRTDRAGDKDGIAYTLITQKEARFAGELVNNLVAAGHIVSTEIMDLAMKVTALVCPTDRHYQELYPVVQSVGMYIELRTLKKIQVRNPLKVLERNLENGGGAPVGTVNCTVELHHSHIMNDKFCFCYRSSPDMLVLLLILIEWEESKFILLLSVLYIHVALKYASLVRVKSLVTPRLDVDYTFPYDIFFGSSLPLSLFID